MMLALIIIKYGIKNEVEVERLERVPYMEPGIITRHLRLAPRCWAGASLNLKSITSTVYFESIILQVCFWIFSSNPYQNSRIATYTPYKEDLEVPPPYNIMILFTSFYHSTLFSNSVIKIRPISL